MLTLFAKLRLNPNINKYLTISASFTNPVENSSLFSYSKALFSIKYKGKIKDPTEKKKSKTTSKKKKYDKNVLARIPGSSTIIHKEGLFKNNIWDKSQVDKKEIMTKTIKILDQVKIQKVKEELEKKKLEILEAEKQTGVIKKTKKMRPKDFIYPNPIEALKALRIEEEIKHKDKDQTIDFVILLDVKEAKKGQGQVRGLVTFPGGAIRAPKLCVFTTKDMTEVAKNAGADLIGDSNMVKDIIDNKGIPFDKCLATTESLYMLKNAARIMGPKGLMPNQKAGTLVEPKFLETTIREMKAGKKEFRINPDNTIRLSIGKKSYTDENLLKNLDSVCNSIYDSKPDGIRNFFVWAFLFPGQGRVYRLDIQSLIPVGENYFYDDYQISKKQSKTDDKAVEKTESDIPIEEVKTTEKMNEEKKQADDIEALNKV